MRDTVVVDGLAPRSLERPASSAELATCLAEATRSHLAVIPIGGGRALGMGDPPASFDVGLDTTGLDRILEHSRADLTVTVEAGISLELLNAELNRVGQFLPLDPFASPGHTIGGILASGWAGPLRLGYGTARDLVIGMTVALPDGRLARSGGRVVKNVSGYDVHKLHLGTMGTLGVIVEVSFKVYPLPLRQVTACFTGDLDQAWAESERALRLPMPPIALVLAGEPNRWRVWARFGGTRGAVERMAHELGWPASDPTIWSQLATRRSDAWARISLPPRHLLPMLRQVSPPLLVEPGPGTAHWLDASEAGHVRALRTAVEELGGSLVLLDAPPELKRAAGTWGRRSDNVDLMLELKRTFDPNGCLSPGRYPY